MKRVGFSLRRTTVLAGNTWTEAVRQRVFFALLLCACGLTAGSLVFREFNFGASELKFVMDFGFGAISVFGSILAIVATAQLFFSEIENRTALTVLAKPVLRTEFIAGKFSGVALVLLSFTAATTMALMAVLWWREQALRSVDPAAFPAGGGVAYGGILIFAGLQVLKSGMLAAAVILIASFSQTSLYTVIVGFLVLVICHLQYIAQDVWSRADLSLLGRIGAGTVAFLFPNFQVFNLGDDVAAGGAVTGSHGARIALYAVVYIAVVLGLAVFSFRRREI